MLGVALDVEADDVAAQHSGKQFATPGKDTKDLLGRPGHVPEKSNREFRSPIMQQSGHQGQVKILNPYDVVVRRLIFGGRGKKAVDMTVRLPVSGLELAVRGQRMNQRP